jgi:hypothetical protein
LTAILFALVPLALISASTAAGSDDSDFRITVRSSVEQAYTRFSKEPLHEHGKSYAIIAMDQVKDIPLVKPANEGEILAQLRTVLSAYGFHEITPGTNPEIVLTVLYGRSHLRNPYLDKTIEIDGAGFGGVRVVSASVDQLVRERSTPGYAEKTISADAEKLFIAVTAWKFPSTAKEKPEQLWRTLMLTDDPDQDLNQLSKKMLAAGAGYFDHPMAAEEVTIPSSVAEGHVILGTPTIVDPKKTKK